MLSWRVLKTVLQRLNQVAIGRLVSKAADLNPATSLLHLDTFSITFSRRSDLTRAELAHL